MKTREFGLLYISLAANLTFIGLLWPYGRDAAANSMIATGILILFFSVVIVPAHMMVNLENTVSDAKPRTEK